MLTWIIQIAVMSIVLIILVHHLIHFFKTALIVPKLNDLVNRPNSQYDNIYNIVKHANDNPVSKEYTLIDLLPQKEKEKEKGNTDSNMKDELKDFLKFHLRE